MQRMCRRFSLVIVIWCINSLFIIYSAYRHTDKYIRRIGDDLKGVRGYYNDNGTQSGRYVNNQSEMISHAKATHNSVSNNALSCKL